MIFIYKPHSAVVDAFVNGKDGVAVHLEPGEDGYGDSEEYAGDELLFESRDLARAWAEALLAQLS